MAEVSRDEIKCIHDKVSIGWGPNVTNTFLSIYNHKEGIYRLPTSTLASDIKVLKELVYSVLNTDVVIIPKEKLPGICLMIETIESLDHKDSAACIKYLHEVKVWLEDNGTFQLQPPAGPEASPASLPNPIHQLPIGVEA